MEMYYADNGVYPVATGFADGAGANITAVTTSPAPYLKINSMTIEVTNSVQYVRAPSQSAYGLNVLLERTGLFCLIEVGASGTNWWGLGSNYCNF